MAKTLTALPADSLWGGDPLSPGDLPTVPAVSPPEALARDRAARAFSDRVAQAPTEPAKKRRGGPRGVTRPPSWEAAARTRQFLSANAGGIFDTPREMFAALAERLEVSPIAVIRVCAGDLPLPCSWANRLSKPTAPDVIRGPGVGTSDEP